MEKMKKNSIKVYWLILLFVFGNCPQVFAQEDTQPIRNMELLFVIDDSRSVGKEAESIRRTIDSLQDWLEDEPLISSVEYVAMTGEAKYTKYDNFSYTGDYTCIKKGVELADQWLKDRLDDGNVKGIVFVTDLVESHKVKRGEVFDKEAEQKGIDEILEQWEDNYSDEMDYLFITWKVDVNDIEPEKEFVCKISDSKQYILDKSIENDSEEVISEIKMTGTIMEKIMEILTGVKLEGDYRPSALKQIYRISWIYAYIILGKEDQLSVPGEQGDYQTLDAAYQTDSMKIYRLTEQDAKKDYQLQSDNVLTSYFLFYIPKVNMLVSFSNDNIRAGKNFQIRCSFMANDYRQKIVKDPLYICFINQETNEITKKIKLEKTDGEFKGNGVLEQSGVYSYEIQTEGKEILEKGEITIKEASKKDDITMEDDTTKKGSSIAFSNPEDNPYTLPDGMKLSVMIIAAVILISLTVIAAVFMVNKR